MSPILKATTLKRLAENEPGAVKSARRSAKRIAANRTLSLFYGLRQGDVGPIPTFLAGLIERGGRLADPEAFRRVVSVFGPAVESIEPGKLFGDTSFIRSPDAMKILIGELKPKPEHLGRPLFNLLAVEWWAKGHVAAAGEMLRVLTEGGALVDSRDDRGASVLFAAAGTPNLANYCRELLARGADVNACDEDGETPLHVAESGAVPMLLTAGAMLEARNSFLRTPLFDAVARNKLKEVGLLLAAGAQTDVVCAGFRLDQIPSIKPKMRALLRPYLPQRAATFQ